MTRLPYDTIALEAERIIMKMVLAPSWETSHYYWKLYLGYIDACGWDNESYDQELLKRVDASWDKYLYN